MNADKPAFPTAPINLNSGGTYHNDGLTKRELIAAKAMQGILANYWCQNDWKDKLSALDFGIVAQQSVGYADALIEELQKSK